MDLSRQALLQFPPPLRCKDDESLQFGHLAITESPDIAVRMRACVPLLVRQRDLAECGNEVAVADHVVNLEAGRLFVRYGHPLANGLLASQDRVTHEVPDGVFGAELQESFEVAIHD